MAYTIYKMLKDMLNNTMLSDVTDKIKIILTALDTALSKEKIQDYISIFLGLAAAIIVAGFLIDLYDKASRDLLTVQRLVEIFMKIFVSVAVIIFLPDLLHTTLQISYGMYGLVEEKAIISSSDATTFTLYGNQIGFNAGVSIAEDEESRSQGEKRSTLEDDHDYYGYSTTSGYYIYYSLKDLQEQYPSVTEQDQSGTMGYAIIKGSDIKNASSDVSYILVDNGEKYDLANEELDGLAEAEKIYDADGNTLEAKETEGALDETGFPSYDYCKVTGGLLYEGESIKEAMEETFGSSWISAATKGKLSMTTIMMSGIFSIANKIISLVVLVFTITNAVVLMCLTVMAPIAVAQMFGEGANANGIRYLKKFIATALNFVLIVIVLYAVSELQKGTIESIIGTRNITANNIEDAVGNSLLFLVYKIAAVMAILGGAKLTNDLVGG